MTARLHANFCTNLIDEVLFISRINGQTDSRCERYPCGGHPSARTVIRTRHIPSVAAGTAQGTGEDPCSLGVVRLCPADAGTTRKGSALVAAMGAVTTDQLAQWADGEWTAVPGDWVPTAGFSIDTRTLRPGQIFVALRGERDGHDYVPAAAKAGASAAIVERPVDLSRLPQLVVRDAGLAFRRIAAGYRRRFSGPVISITGSCGKTSTKDILRGMLGTECTHATAGNLNNTLGVPLTLTGLNDDLHRFAVVEVGISVPGEMATLAAMIEPDLVVITTIAPAHLAGLGSVTGVAEEKLRLATRARPNAPVIVPANIAGLEPVAALGDRLEVLTPAGHRCPGKRWEWAAVAGCDDQVVLKSPAGNEMNFRLPQCSAGMCDNLLLAAMAAILCGQSEASIANGISGWRPGKLRGEIVQRPGKIIYLDCYNANPASMADAVQYFEDHVARSVPRLYVLGSMGELGERAAELHAEVAGRLRPRPGDGVIFTGPHAAAYRSGLALDPAGLAHFEIAGDCLGIGAVFDNFEGAVFIKGSRSERLERLLERLDNNHLKGEGASC